ncbi:MAG: hypothetical protein HY481_00660 [Candidatus Vogelbacteria bacterium]|nr:hypothetical protein [Candidatus Vogelbacteria bacterium]
MSKKQKIYLWSYLIFTALFSFIIYLLRGDCTGLCMDDKGLISLPILGWLFLTIIIFMLGAYKIPKNRVSNKLLSWIITVILWLVIIVVLKIILK